MLAQMNAHTASMQWRASSLSARGWSQRHSYMAREDLRELVGGSMPFAPSSMGEADSGLIGSPISLRGNDNESQLPQKQVVKSRLR